MPDPAIPAYGEDAEAASLNKPAKAPATPAPVPPNVATPTAGTTETDLARNIEQANKRKAALRE